MWVVQLVTGVELRVARDMGRRMISAVVMHIEQKGKGSVLNFPYLLLAYFVKRTVTT